ncbi:MAG TPA: tail fiber domain-containing protein, partial [Flavobacterium sp.]
RRWKSDIKSSDLGLDFIKELHPVSYVRKNDESKKLEYGFIAQELEQTLDKFGATHTGIVSKAKDGMLSVRYNDLLAPMVKAIQEQQVIIEQLTRQMEELEKSEK